LNEPEAAGREARSVGTWKIRRVHPRVQVVER
jgi:hypothetical protein